VPKPDVAPQVIPDVIMPEVSMAEAAPVNQKARLPSAVPPLLPSAMLPPRLIAHRNILRNLRPQRVVGVAQK
jgi:hypothetical protein